MTGLGFIIGVLVGIIGACLFILAKEELNGNTSD